MEVYQKCYAILFNAISDALEELERLNIGAAAERLRMAQQEAEDCYIDSGVEEEEGTE